MSASGQDQKFQGNCSWCRMCGQMSRDPRKKAEHNNRNSQCNGWSGTSNQDRGKPEEIIGAIDDLEAEDRLRIWRSLSRRVNWIAAGSENGDRCCQERIEIHAVVPCPPRSARELCERIWVECHRHKMDLQSSSPKTPNE